jgi:hypothetical protein
MIDQDFNDQFETKLATLYSQILQYQAQTVCQLSKNAFMQSFALPSTWESLIADIKTSHAACMEKMRLLTDFRLNEVRIEIQDMSQYLEHRFEKMEDAQLSTNVKVMYEYIGLRD